MTVNHQIGITIPFITQKFWSFHGFRLYFRINLTFLIYIRTSWLRNTYYLLHLEWIWFKKKKWRHFINHLDQKFLFVSSVSESSWKFDIFYGVESYRLKIIFHVIFSTQNRKVILKEDTFCVFCKRRHVCMHFPCIFLYQQLTLYWPCDKLKLHFCNARILTKFYTLSKKDTRIRQIKKARCIYCAHLKSIFFSSQQF